MLMNEKEENYLFIKKKLSADPELTQCTRKRIKRNSKKLTKYRDTTRIRHIHTKNRSERQRKIEEKTRSTVVCSV